MADETSDQGAVKIDAPTTTAPVIPAAIPATTPATAAAPVPAATATFVPAITFTGYPEDYSINPAGVVFMAGVESPPVPQDFVDLMKTKGLVAETPVADKQPTKPVAG